MSEFSFLPARTFTVSELNAAITLLLERNFGFISVEGEVSNLRIPSSGHHYFNLKDEQSLIRAVLFKGQKAGIPFTVEEGQQLICLGRLSLYSPRGEYQLIVEQMEPSGLGSLHLAFEQLKKKLEKEGFFEEKKKKKLPPFPAKIGIVTSPTGAAIRDILHVLERRKATVDIVIAPSRVQGTGAAKEIAAAIDTLDALNDIDVIIVGRGGGSIEDLWAFNEECVARAIDRARKPVISAVGHETDVTIADFVADVRAPTPSSAAEIVAQSGQDLLREITALTGRLEMAARTRTTLLRGRLDMVMKGLNDPGKKLTDMRLRLDDLLMRMEKRVREKISLQRVELKGSAGRLHSLSPLAVLSRGYSITTRLSDHQIIRNENQVKSGDRLGIRLHKGELHCLVQEKVQKSRER